MRTKEEIERQIEGLTKMKEWLPEYNMFGSPNHKRIDAQISILDESEKLDDIDEGDWDQPDETNDIYRDAEEAKNWLDDKDYDDLFEVR